MIRNNFDSKFNMSNFLNTLKLTKTYTQLFFKKSSTMLELLSSHQGFIINELSFYECELSYSQINIKHYKKEIEEIENNFSTFDDIDQGLKHNEMEIYQHNIKELETYCASLNRVISKRKQINTLERTLNCLKVSR